MEEETIVEAEMEAPEIDSDKLKELYESLGIEERYLNSDRSGRYRLNAIHVRGVNEMSTEDILEYFGNSGCTSIEWINDYSCNGIWPNSSLAAEALLTMSKTMEPSSTDRKNSQRDEDSEDYGIALSENEDCQSEHSLPPAEAENKVKDSAKEEEENLISGIPVPPGIWRIGIPHKKSPMILMRFALKSDKKVPGAEKRSQYYKKYGNPNYGGMVGLISKSRKRQFKSTELKEKKENQLFPTNSKDDDSESSSDEEYEMIGMKRIKMKMYADKEAKLAAKRRSRTVGDLRNKLKRSSSNQDYTLLEKTDEEPAKVAHDLRIKLARQNENFEARNTSSSDLRSKLNRLHEKRKWSEKAPLVIELLPDED